MNMDDFVDWWLWFIPMENYKCRNIIDDINSLNIMWVFDLISYSGTIYCSTPGYEISV